jgi:hypothetical protein
MSENSPSSRSERVPFARPVHVTPLDASGQPMRLVGGNLSRTGMFLRSQLLLPPGTKVSLAFEAKGQPLPFAEAEVVWQRAPSADGGTSGFALRFSRFLNPKGPELVEQLVSLGRNKLAEAEAKLARDAAPAAAAAVMPAELEDAQPAVPAAARPPPMPADATPPEQLPAIRLSGQKPSFATGTGPASIGVPRPATFGSLESESDEVTLGEVDVDSPPTALRSSKVKGPSAGALALLVGVPLVIAVAAWRASATREPALAVLEKPAATETAAAAPAPVPPQPTEVAAPTATAPTPAPEAQQAPAAEPVVAAAPALPVEPAVPVAAAAQAAPAPVALAAPIPVAAPARPEPAVEKKATPAPAPAPERAKKPAEQGAARGASLRLGGAVAGVSLKSGGSKLDLDLDLARGARVKRAFALKGPHRLVVDISGGPAGKALEKGISGVAGVQRARVGAPQGGVTRLVLDLSRPAGKVTQAGDRVTLGW